VFTSLRGVPANVAPGGDASASWVERLMMNDAGLSRDGTLLSMSPVSRGRTSKKQKKVQKSRQRSARAVVQREDTQSADLLPVGSRPGQPSSGFRALSALVDQLAGPRERPAWFGPSIGRMLRQQDGVIAATSPRELEQAVTELAGAEVYSGQGGGG
jgi:hypothetical protein